MKKLLFLFLMTILILSCQLITEEESLDFLEDSNELIVKPNQEITMDNPDNKDVYYALVNTTDYVSNARGVVDEHALVADFCSSPRNVNNPSQSVLKAKDFNIGSIKEMYVNVRGSYVKKPAILLAKNEKCYVWVLKEDTFFPRSRASYLLESFKKIYDKVVSVVGEETSDIYSSIYGDTVPMKENSETSDKINILIYDIYSDGYSGNTIGLFSSMDFYCNGLHFKNIITERSNEGKYLYIDSLFCYTRELYAISTLAHELQHLIHFGRKTMKGCQNDNSLNEMMSMLCEDIIQNDLGIPNECSPKNRIPTFLSNYYKVGFRDFDNTLTAYANAYSFGSWLQRKYGTSILRLLMDNGKSGKDCILAAVESITGIRMTFNDLFYEFLRSALDNDTKPIIFGSNTLLDPVHKYGTIIKKYEGDKSVIKLRTTDFLMFVFLI